MLLKEILNAAITNTCDEKGDQDPMIQISPLGNWNIVNKSGKITMKLDDGSIIEGVPLEGNLGTLLYDMYGAIQNKATQTIVNLTSQQMCKQPLVNRPEAFSKHLTSFEQIRLEHISVSECSLA